MMKPLFSRHITLCLLALPLLAGCDAVATLMNPQEDTAVTESQSVPTSNADAAVEFVRAVQTGPNTWTFHVTVRHEDTGWDDYANGWDVVLADGTVLRTDESDAFTRVLLHPHENEQPFTRSQNGLRIPEEVTSVTVRAHDLVDGFGGPTVTVDLTQDSGEGFEVERTN